MSTGLFVTGWNSGDNKYIKFGRLFSLLILVFSSIAYITFGINGLILFSLLYIGLLLSLIILMLIEMQKNRQPGNNNHEWPEVDPLTEQDF